MAMTPPDVQTLICEVCQWVDPAENAKGWSHDLGRDFCDICTARLKAKQEERKAA